MNRKDANIWGVLFVIGGVLLLLHNFGFLAQAEHFVWVALFALGGLAFLAVFLRKPADWWAVIPGFVLLGLAGRIILGDLFPALAARWDGGLFLASVGLSFWVIYLTHREHWWAVIPGGALFSLALVAGLSSVITGPGLGGVLFLGLGATFGLVYLLPPPAGRMRWALIPAAVLLIVGGLLAAAVTESARYIWPAALILLGLYLLYQALRPVRK